MLRADRAEENQLPKPGSHRKFAGRYNWIFNMCIPVFKALVCLNTKPLDWNTEAVLHSTRRIAHLKVLHHLQDRFKNSNNFFFHRSGFEYKRLRIRQEFCALFHHQSRHDEAQLQRSTLRKCGIFWRGEVGRNMETNLTCLLDSHKSTKLNARLERGHWRCTIDPLVFPSNLLKQALGFKINKTKLVYVAAVEPSSY